MVSELIGYFVDIANWSPINVVDVDLTIDSYRHSIVIIDKHFVV
jgi:hypothetical protein